MGEIKVKNYNYFNFQLIFIIKKKKENKRKK